MAQQQWCPPKRGGRVDFNPLSQAHCCDYFMVTVVNSYFCDLNSVPFRPVFLQNTDQHAAARVGGRRGIGNEVCDLHFVCNHQHEAVAANGLNSDRRTSPQCLSGPEHVQLLVDSQRKAQRIFFATIHQPGSHCWSVFITAAGGAAATIRATTHFQPSSAACEQ